MDGVESENYSLSSSLPTKIANGSEDFNPSMESVPNIPEATANPTKSEDYSSCEDETDESYSDIDSEMREESTEKDSSLLSVNTNTIKRFSGNCDSVTDVLTEHDRTKNRKTYQVTKTLNGNTANSTGVIEKLEMSFASVSEGINIKLEESTSAEDYFYSAATGTVGDVVETFINDLISQAAEHCDKFPDQDNNCENVENSDFDEENANLRGHDINGHKKEDIDNGHFKKRLSNTSKASSDSSASIPSREHNKMSIVEPYDSDRDSGRDSQKSDRDANTAESENEKEKKQEPEPLTQEKLDWNKAQETMENSKKNVEILRQNALDGNSKYFKRKVSMDNKRYSDRIHPFHTHMLLYYGVYDTEQVLYAFQTLRNIIACDCRTFVCLSTTTSITNSPIKQQLVR